MINDAARQPCKPSAFDPTCPGLARLAMTAGPGQFKVAHPRHRTQYNPVIVWVARVIIVCICFCALAVNARSADSSLSDSGKVLQWIEELKKHTATQNWDAKLKTARHGVTEKLGRQSDLRVEVMILALGALGDYVNLRGSTAKLDDEAQRYHDEGYQKALGDRAAQVQIDHMLALYYSKSHRNGLALPYMLRELEYLKIQDDIEQLFVAYGGLASAYGDMGQLGLEKHYRRLTLTLAQEHFIVGLRPPAGQLWITYLDLIKAYMDDIASPGKSAELLELWDIAEPIYFAYGSFPSKGYMSLAYYLSLAGDYDKARHYYKKAKKELNRETAQHPSTSAALRRDFMCNQAEFQLQLRHYRQAASEIKRCIEHTHELKMKPDMTLYTKLGIAREHSGDLQGAIQSYRDAIAQAEVLRSSFGVAERATFFRSLSRRAYWGLIRCYAKRGAAKRKIPDLYLALQASELVRARQLGELIDPQSEPSIALERFEKLHKSLAPTEVVLDYILTDREIVILAVSQGEWSAHIVDYNPTQFSRKVRRLAADLADPHSSPAGIRQRLAGLTATLIKPAAAIMRGKGLIIVLPDGAANLIPFDLLIDPQTQKALIEDRIVKTVPSLRLLKRLRKQTSAARQDSLYAVADPVYRSDYQVAGLSRSDLKTVARGSNYLTYFTQLPETRTEVQSIARLFPKNKVKLLLGKTASESAIKRAKLNPYQFVHLATHGILEGEVPGVAEPALVFSAEKGQDGFLTASEASELSLKAELTVLSACKTGTGEFVTGEGVMGMSRAFLLAGSQNVLVSLWSVDSKMTELLMVKFYQHLRAGKNPAGALREAKLELLTDYQQGGNLTRGVVRIIPEEPADRTRLHPFYWAAFILMGG